MAVANAVMMSIYSFLNPNICCVVRGHAFSGGAKRMMRVQNLTANTKHVGFNTTGHLGPLEFFEA
ncbi:hypothetical protein [Mesorhizobium caraganae]|uniref:hypothetical protein n=1 Tax=Mesorhizobium caraganae TaxID=483206 RepID=UPI001783DEEF|nr:hypothetical protein [Mesorhizobium caraganae]